jgi:hypothetical protein
MYLSTHTKAGFPSWDVTNHRTDNLQPELERSENKASRSSENLNQTAKPSNAQHQTAQPNL